MLTENEHDDLFFNSLRQKEYSALDASGHIYLDYTGANLCPQSLLDKHHQFLQANIYGNPHSLNPASALSEKMINDARLRVLGFFNAQEYACIFTNNASGALQIVGECYPFSTRSHLLLTSDNHNSVNGIRGYCSSKGGSCSYVPMNTADLSVNEKKLEQQIKSHQNCTDKLFAFPAQSNASGVKHDLNWIEKAHQYGWDVLLDAAAFVPTSALDLQVCKPDFVCMSFYKIFGYPTGIGCLLVKKSKLDKLHKCWFAGGTLCLSAIKHKAHFFKTNYEKFESGTVNFLGIPAIKDGLDFIDTIGIERINRRIKTLGSYFSEKLHCLKHANGNPLVKMYGTKDMCRRGGNFLFNFFDAGGKQHSFTHIEEKANKENICLRSGCFCNPGIDELNHHISQKQLRRYFAGRSCGDYEDMIKSMGISRGALRVSVGCPTTKKDIDGFIQFAEKLCT